MKPHSNYLADILGASGRFKALDGLRGLAVLAVVVYHFGTPFNTYYPSDETAPYAFTLGELGVQLFFIISGFVILMSAAHGKTAKGFVISRFTRLYPTYWFAVIFSAALITWVGIEARQINLVQVLINLTMFQRFVLVENVDQVYWTLAVEMQFYLLMLVCILVSKGRLRNDYLMRLGLLWSSIGFALMALYPGDSSTGIAKMVVWAVLAQHAAFFCFGMAMYMYFNTRTFSWYIPFFATVAVANTYLAHGLAHALGVLVIVVLFFAVVQFRNVAVLDRGPLQFLGRISYSLYLFHTILGFIIIHLTQNYLGLWGSRLLSLAVVVTVSYVSYIFLERKISMKIKLFLQR
ncbi:acyltransferase [Rothia nasimurium]|uniref:acyltransferase family protein n=1 Tax=Rothia nasimurium TaxID=85336 RepID=UPI001627BB45|nr:acyltransferase [Rothia nasimurium]